MIFIYVIPGEVAEAGTFILSTSLILTDHQGDDNDAVAKCRLLTKKIQRKELLGNDVKRDMIRRWIRR